VSVRTTLVVAYVIFVLQSKYPSMRTEMSTSGLHKWLVPKSDMMPGTLVGLRKPSAAGVPAQQPPLLICLHQCPGLEAKEQTHQLRKRSLSGVDDDLPGSCIHYPHNSVVAAPLVALCEPVDADEMCLATDCVDDPVPDVLCVESADIEQPKLLELLQQAEPEVLSAPTHKVSTLPKWPDCIFGLSRARSSYRHILLVHLKTLRHQISRGPLGAKLHQRRVDVQDCAS
jgi:hypothetical protein